MPIDPFMIGTAVLSCTTAIAGAGWAIERMAHGETKDDAAFGVEAMSAKLLSRNQAILNLNAILVPLQAADEKRRARLRQNGIKGRAIQIAAAIAAKAERTRAALEATAKTREALPGLALRSRAQVVSPVKARRTRARNAAAAIGA